MGDSPGVGLWAKHMLKITKRNKNGNSALELDFSRLCWLGT